VSSEPPGLACSRGSWLWIGGSRAWGRIRGAVVRSCRPYEQTGPTFPGLWRGVVHRSGGCPQATVVTRGLSVGTGRLDSGEPPGVVGATCMSWGRDFRFVSQVRVGCCSGSVRFWVVVRLVSRWWFAWFSARVLVVVPPWSSPRVSLRGVLAGRAGLWDGRGSVGGWVGRDSVGWFACHPVDLPPGYHTASRGPGPLVQVVASGFRDPLTRCDRASPGRRDGRQQSVVSFRSALACELRFELLLLLLCSVVCRLCTCRPLLLPPMRPCPRKGS
jgi:hypothetical protein